MTHTLDGRCDICGWAHTEAEPHHAYEAGEIDVWEVLCPDGKRRHLLRATEFAAQMCAQRADMRCGARLPGKEHEPDRCPARCGGNAKHTYRIVERTDPRYLALLEEDRPDDPYNRFREIAEMPLLLPHMPITLHFEK